MKANRLTIPPKVSRELREVAAFQGKGLQFVVSTSGTEGGVVDRHQRNPLLSIWEYCEGMRPLPSSFFSGPGVLDLLWQPQLIRNLSYGLEGVVFQAFKECEIRFTPTSRERGRFFKYEGNTSTVANCPVTIPHLQDINRYLRTTLHAAPFETGYISLATIQAIRGFKDDHRFESWRQYLKPEMVWYPGEVGQVDDTRLIEVSHPGLLDSHQRNHSGFGEMLVFGCDPLTMYEERVPELRFTPSKPRQAPKGLDWHGLVGFQEVWDSEHKSGRVVYVTG